MNTLITTDISAAIGDTQGALRGLWGDIIQEQGTSLELQDIAAYVKPDTFLKTVRRVVILKRTFDMRFPGMPVMRFWRVMSQWHSNANSDLSVAGLKQWRII